MLSDETVLESTVSLVAKDITIHVKDELRLQLSYEEAKELANILLAQVSNANSDFLSQAHKTDPFSLPEES